MKYLPGMAYMIDDQHNVVYSNDSLHHWVDVSQAFRQINKILAKSGHVYIQQDSSKTITIIKLRDKPCPNLVLKS